MKFRISLVTTIYFIVNLVYSSVIINKPDDSICLLDIDLRNEIIAHKIITEIIKNEIISKGLGDIMYNEYVRFIDKFGARVSGTRNLEDAIDYMVNLTKKYGVTDVRTEDVKAPHWVRGTETAEMLHPRKKKIEILGFGTSVTTPGNGITAEVLVVSNFDELDALHDSQVNGKIVVFNAHYISYGETVVYQSQGATRASKKGAVATLVRSITPFSIYSPHTGAQFYGRNVTKIPTAAITLEDADLLYRLQTEGEKIIIHMKMFSTFDYQVSRNVIVDHKGTEYPDKTVIVSGHIDSWDVGEGAMDDGGGMFISWFVPIVLHKLNIKTKRTVRAILWTAEEPGLVGAQSYLKKHESELSSIDLIMESDEGTFEPLGLDLGVTKNAKCLIQNILNLFEPTNKITVSGSPGSDITIFVDKGVPGASLLNENERYFWYHHSEGDTLDVQNPEYVKGCLNLWAGFSMVVANITADIPRT